MNTTEIGLTIKLLEKVIQAIIIGIYKYRNGDVYEGSLKDGLKDGKGIKTI